MSNELITNEDRQRELALAAERKKKRLAYEQSLYQATLTTDKEVQTRRYKELLTALPEGSLDTYNANIQRRDLLAQINNIAPEDEVERMLTYQIITAHQFAMQAFERANRRDVPPARQDDYMKRAEKLMAAFAKHVAALDKHRGKGQQKVTVEHVHVHDGGQAVVGNIEAGAEQMKGTKSLEHRRSDQPAE
jgi:hypothetical protein